MEYNELRLKIREYPIGTVFDIRWDRGNGDLEEHFVYFGDDDKEIPILKSYGEGRSLNNYGRVVRFDISSESFVIRNVVVDASKSLEYLDD